MFELRDARTQKEMVNSEAYKRKMAYEEKMNNFIDYVLSRIQKSLDTAIQKLEYTTRTVIFDYEIKCFDIIPDFEIVNKILNILGQKKYGTYEISTEPTKIIITLDFSIPKS